jgi:HK97 gp10 family phage protein
MLKFKSNLKDVEQTLKQAEERTLEAVGIFVRGEMQVRSPVDTGNLRDSNDYKVNDNNVMVGNTVEYAIHVHEGTSKQQPQKWIEDSVMQNQQKIRRIIVENLSIDNVKVGNMRWKQ